MSPALELRNIALHRDTTVILDDVTWTARPGEHWIILGANGSGKTSLMRIAALYLHPSAGEVVVAGERLGNTDVRSLRRRVAYMSAAFATELRPQLRAFEVVMTAKHAALEPWWHTYDHADRNRAVACLEQLGVAHLSEREISTLSSGEQQRVFLARTRMNDPAVVLLDEPSGRLDLGGREQLVRAIDDAQMALIVGALLYFLNPLDLVADALVGIGFLDDVGVLGIVLRKLRAGRARSPDSP